MISPAETTCLISLRDIPLTSQRLLEDLEKAHVYIEQLNKEIDKLKEEVRLLKGE